MTQARLSRQQFIDHLRSRKAGMTDIDAAALPTDLSIARRCSPNEALTDLFCRNAGDVGLNADRCPQSELDQCIEDILRQHEVTSALISIEDERLRSIVTSVLSAASIPSHTWPVASRDEVLHVDLSITDVAAAIAESGSIVHDAGPGRSRCGHVVAPLHIALVPVDRIHADLLDFFASPACDESVQRSASTVLVTGPSKTGDIEGILVTGVHGPHHVHVLVLDETQTPG